MKEFTEWLFAKRWRAWLIMIVTLLVFLVTAFYTVENLRGRKAWDAAVTLLEANGETLDFLALKPAPIPDDENFCAIPLLREIGIVDENRPEADEIEARRERLRALSVTPGTAARPGYDVGERADLEEIRSAFMEDGTLEFDESIADPAAALLAALNAHGDVWEELDAAAASRPRALMIPTVHEVADPDQLLNYGMPHPGCFTAVAKAARYRSLAAIRLGDRETARRSLAIIFRLGEASRGEGTLLAHLVDITLLAMVLPSLWESLAEEGFWSEEDLAWLQGELARIDVPAGLLQALRSEVLLSTSVLDTGKSQGPGPWSPSGGPVYTPGMGFDLENIAIGLAPSGWWDQNRATLVRWYWTYRIEPLRRGGLEELRRQEPAFRAAISKAKGNIDVYAVMATIAAPVVLSVGERASYTEARLRQALVACALERYFRATKRYPEALDELAPQFLEAIPVDLDEKPMRYRRDPRNGRYELWSVGFDLTDDGAERNFDPDDLRRWSRSQRKSGFLGDWVWGYVPDPELAPVKKDD